MNSGFLSKYFGQNQTTSNCELSKLGNIEIPCK
jgi:hypothetical protein